MYKIALLALLTLFTASCSQRWCNTRYPAQTSKDSIYIETIKEIPVIIPGDTVNVSVPVNCPDQDLVNVETAKLKQTIKILNGKLVSSTNIKPDTVFVHTKETKTITKEVKVLEPVKYIPKVYKQALSICIFIFSVVFIWLGWKAYSFFKPKIKL